MLTTSLHNIEEYSSFERMRVTNRPHYVIQWGEKILALGRFLSMNRLQSIIALHELSDHLSVIIKLLWLLERTYFMKWHQNHLTVHLRNRRCLSILPYPSSHRPLYSPGLITSLGLIEHHSARHWPLYLYGNRTTKRFWYFKGIWYWNRRRWGGPSVC